MLVGARRSLRACEATTNAVRSSERRTNARMWQKRRRKRLVIVHVWRNLSGSLTRPHMSPNRCETNTDHIVRDEQRRNGGVVPIRSDGGNGRLADARRLAGQDVWTK